MVAIIMVALFMVAGHGHTKGRPSGALRSSANSLVESAAGTQVLVPAGRGSSVLVVSADDPLLEQAGRLWL